MGSMPEDQAHANVLSDSAFSFGSMAAKSRRPGVRAADWPRHDLDSSVAAS